MKPLLISLLLLTLAACYPSVPTTPQDRYDAAMQALASAATDEDRFYALGDAAKQAFELGRYAKAEQFATELQTLIPKFKTNWNYGNAIQDSHLVLGRLAVRAGDLETAKQHLLAAARSSGSPQMNSFGPNMSLAKDLLEQGETKVVLQYFDLCRRFWNEKKLDQWSKEVKAGKIPDFGANLVY